MRKFNKRNEREGRKSSGFASKGPKEFTPRSPSKERYSDSSEPKGFDQFDRENSGPRSGGNRSERRGFDRENSSFGRRSSQDMFKIKCAKCGTYSEVPFKPTAGKPVYCYDCFKQTDAYTAKQFTPTSSSPSSRNEFDIINEKLDKIMDVLHIR